MAVQLLSRIRESFAVELELKKLFELPTIAQLAELIDEQLQAGSQVQLPPIVPVARDRNLPLSFPQERLLFLEQLEPGGAIYNLHAALRLKGILDLAALEQSFNEIIRRHESLRTTLELREGEPVQLIVPTLTIPLPLMDVSPHSVAETEALRLAAEEGQRPFDLGVGPLLRALAIRIDVDDHLVVLTMHHAISDGWSMGILLRELSALYAAYSQHTPSPLTELPIQYADYASWQRKCLEGEWLESHLAYWREVLAGAPPVLELPADRPRAAVQSFAGATEVMVLDQDLSRRLRSLSQEQGVTLFMTLLAAFKVLLSRYTGQPDIVVGTPIANRNRIETEALIGFFINSLALRTDLSGNPSFTKLLRRVFDVTLSAYAHQEVPLEKLLQDLQPERDLSRTPLFQVYFNMLNFPLGDLQLPGLTSQILSFPDAWSKFDLTLYVEDQESIRCNLVYNANLFEPPRMAEMLAQFKHLLLQIVEQPEVEIGRFTLITPAAEKHLPNPKMDLSAKWEGAVHTLFSRHARQFPNKPAVIDKQATWTYAQLESRSNQIANYLLSSGIQSEDVVAIYAHRSAPLVLALLGVLKAGASFLLLDPAYPATRLIDCLKLAKPRGWIQLQAAGVPPEYLKDFVTSQISCVLELPERLDEAGDRLANASTEEPQVVVGADSLAYLAFTSGTSGKPKGIQGRHGPLSHFRPWYKQNFAINESDRFSLLSGLSHDPLHRDVFTPWQFGATICIPDPELLGTPGYLAEWMRSEEITVTNLTPAMGQLLTSELKARTPVSITSLRYAFFVGDALTRRDVARLKKLAPQFKCVNLYGSTETQRAVSCFMGNGHEELDTRDEGEILPLGKGIEDVQLLLMNDAQQLAGIGEVGEIFIRSPHLARGYLDDQTLTEARFIPNPFTGSIHDRLYRTGDLGRYLPDGNVASLGRCDFQVKIRGFRVELTEIEAVLGRHAAIQEAVVIAVEERSGERLLVAFVIWQRDLRVTTGELRRYIKEQLPDYMVPAFFIELDEIPLTPNGKLDRQALAKLAQTRPELMESESRQYTPTEEILAGIWAEVLHVEPIGLHNNFFELGGHSLVITRVISRVRESFHVEIPLRWLFEKPTVSELAAAIDREQQLHQVLPPIGRAPRNAELPLSFAQQRLWFMNQLEPDTTAYNLSAALWLNGPLDVDAFQRTLNEIARRHEVLRTNFVTSAGRPRQVVSSDVTTPLTIVDLSSLSEADHEAETQRLVVADAQRPFDLAHDRLWRATLFKLGPQKHAGLLTLHHIVADGWSLEILVHEVATLYEAFAQGNASPLPELEIQYADFAVWQHEWLQGELLESHLAYWREQLSGITVLRLPTDRPRPESGRRTFGGMKYPLELSRELSDALKHFSQREGLTLLMTTLTCFKVLLRYLSGQEDIVVGTDVANRNHAGIESLIGFFVNQLVLRTSVSPDVSFRELARRLREVALQAYTHQDVPFEKLVETIKPSRNDQLAPLFQVKFLLQNERPGVLDLAGLTLSPLAVDNELMDMDLIISLSETPAGLRGWINGDRNLFQVNTLARLGTLFETLLQSVVINPDQSVAQLMKLLAEVDRRERLAEKARQEENKLKRFKAIKPGTVKLTMSAGE
ncbi:MAG TPA: amino acid adenylation domain-containing protein [Pyrinomonadaceae bacterium]